MNFIADEGVDRQIVDALRQDGHSVLYVAELAPGITDVQVLGLANNEGALLVTVDKDFGEIVFRQRLTATGIVLLRVEGLPVDNKIETVRSAISSHATELDKAFTVISPKLVRIRRLIE